MQKRTRKRRRTPWQPRFLSKVRIGRPGECWEWSAYIGTHGYGVFNDAAAPEYLAHRLMYHMANGPLTPGLVIDHLCENKRCVNPGHLRLVTQRQNILRGGSAGAWNAAKTQCKNGHPYNAVNTYRRPDGMRDCRACKRERERARRRAA